MKTLKRTELEEKLKQYKELNQNIKALEAEKESIKKALVSSYFEKHPEYVDKSGRVLASYTTTVRNMFDAKRLKEERPDICEIYSYLQEVHTFLIK